MPTGSLFGLIGPNGAGKTTTLRMLAGSSNQLRGDNYNGELIHQNLTMLRRQIGFMPDFFGVSMIYSSGNTSILRQVYDLPRNDAGRSSTSYLNWLTLREKRGLCTYALAGACAQRLCAGPRDGARPQVLLRMSQASGLDPRARVEMPRAPARAGGDGQDRRAQFTHPF